MRSQKRRKTFTWLYLSIFRLCKEKDVKLEKGQTTMQFFVAYLLHFFICLSQKLLYENIFIRLKIFITVEFSGCEHLYSLSLSSPIDFFFLLFMFLSLFFPCHNVAT